MYDSYGPWMDTNLVWPLTHDTCAVIFDYYLDTSVVPRNQLDSYVTQSLRASAGVQEEDRELCESVQAGLRSTAYRAGRYAPQVLPLLHSTTLELINNELLTK
jgi:choline monooxygenase